MTSPAPKAAEKHWALVANGELPADAGPVVAKQLAAADCVVAVDGGLRHCAALGVWPTILLGDLDSAPPDLVAQAVENGSEIHEFPSDKDATDLELALDLAGASAATKVTVVAAFGGRLDHELATMSLLAAERWGAITIAATDGSRHAHVVRERCNLRLEPGTTVSLLPWHGQAHGVTTQGMQWSLADAVLAPGTTHGVSNIAVDPEQAVSVTSGVLLVVVDTTS